MHRFVSLLVTRRRVPRALPAPDATRARPPPARAHGAMIDGMVAMSTERFEELVASSLDSLPESLGRAMENVSVTVDPFAPAGRLFGLYEGVPLTHRGIGYSAVMPDRITIFMRSICASCRSEEEVTAAVRKTVVHEIAHHFGINDAAPRRARLGLIARPSPQTCRGTGDGPAARPWGSAPGREPRGVRRPEPRTAP